MKTTTTLAVTAFTSFAVLTALPAAAKPAGDPRQPENKSQGHTPMGRRSREAIFL